jgi:hypothetical protein
LNQNRALAFCFDAFSSREPVPTSLENAIGGRFAQRARGKATGGCAGGGRRGL